MQEAAKNGKAQANERLSFTVRLAVVYGALFLIYGVHLPYLPVWLDWRGLAPDEIAVITATPLFLRVLITPAAAMLADQLGVHRAMAIWLSGAALVFSLLMSQTSSFVAIFLTAIPFAICVSTVMPLTETLAITGVKTRGLDYGRMRLWGSLTFVAVGFLGGWLIDHLGASSAIWLIVLGAAATALAAHWLPASFTETQVESPSRPSRRRISARDGLRLVRSPIFLLFLLASGAVQGAHGMFYTFGALHWRDQGISTAWVGALWAVGVGCEILLFAYSSSVVRRFGAIPLLVVACAAAVLRWLIMSLDPPLSALIPLQMLHGLTYGASHLGAMHFISRAVPESAAATAQSGYATIAAGVMMGVTTLAAGHLYGTYGGHTYIAMAALAAVGLASSLLVLKRWDGGPLWQAGTQPVAPEQEAAISSRQPRSGVSAP